MGRPGPSAHVASAARGDNYSRCIWVGGGQQGRRASGWDALESGADSTVPVSCFCWRVCSRLASPARCRRFRAMSRHSVPGRTIGHPPPPCTWFRRRRLDRRSHRRRGSVGSRRRRPPSQLPGRAPLPRRAPRQPQPPRARSLDRSPGPASGRSRSAGRAIVREASQAGCCDRTRTLFPYALGLPGSDSFRERRKRRT
jgi:hypothetical protein